MAGAVNRAGNTVSRRGQRGILPLLAAGSGGVTLAQLPDQLRRVRRAVLVRRVLAVLLLVAVAAVWWVYRQYQETRADVWAGTDSPLLARSVEFMQGEVAGDLGPLLGFTSGTLNREVIAEYVDGQPGVTAPVGWGRDLPSSVQGLSARVESAVVRGGRASQVVVLGQYVARWPGGSPVQVAESFTWTYRESSLGWSMTGASRTVRPLGSH